MSTPSPDPRPAAGGWLSPDVPFPPRRWPFFYGWVILLASTLGVAASAPGQTIGFAAFTDVLMAQLGLSRSELSLAYGLGTATSGFLLTRAGRYFDRHGARRTILLAAVCFGLSLAYLGHCDWAVGWGRTPGEVFGIAFVSIAVGFFLARFFGQGVLTMASRAMLSKWFDARRGLVTNISAVVVAGLFSVAPLALDQLIRALGWREAYLVLGAAVLVVVGLSGWLLARDNPEECGLEMDGGVRPEAASRNPDLVMKRDFSRAEALRTYAFWVANLTVSWFGLIITAVTFHITAVGGEEGMARDPLFALFLPMGAVSIAGSFFFAWWSDRTRMKWVIMSGCLCMTVYALGALGFPHAWGQVLFVVGGGLAGSAFQTMTGVVWARFYGRSELGAISGFSMASIVVASAVGPWVFNGLAELTGTYETPLAVAVVVGLTLAASCFGADNPQRKVEL